MGEGRLTHSRRACYEDSLSPILESIDDSKSISSNNNGNGLPEPGETVDLKVILRNISDTETVRNVEARLIPVESNVDVVDDRLDYDRIRDGETASRIYRIEIQDDFEGSKITFRLQIRGEVDGSDERLGTDEFVIPVGGVH